MMVSPTLRSWTWRPHPELTTLHQATGVVFRESPADRFSDWHVGPRRQYVITLSGEAEVGLGDGSVHRFGPGHVNLVEGPDRTWAHDTSCGRRAASDGHNSLGLDGLYPSIPRDRKGIRLGYSSLRSCPATSTSSLHLAWAISRADGHQPAVGSDQQVLGGNVAQSISYSCCHCFHGL